MLPRQSEKREIMGNGESPTVTREIGYSSCGLERGRQIERVGGERVKSG